MSNRLFRTLRARLAPAQIDIARAAFGAGLGVVMAGLMVRIIADGDLSATPLLIPPIGASAVLVFAIPASPLAQPRSVILGNTLSALIGVTCALLIPQPGLAAAIATCCAILGMAASRSLHPPGGAVALGAALIGTSGGMAAYGEILAPTFLCSVLLVPIAMVYARICGRSYPHRVEKAPNVHATADPPPGDRAGYTRADLDAALAQYGELLDVSRDDLDALFRQVEIQAHQRLHALIRCEDIMSRDVLSLRMTDFAEDALAFMQEHDLRTIPVVDDSGRLTGMARRAELQSAGKGAVAAALDARVNTVGPSTPIEALLPILSTGGVHEVMVVDADGLLIGVITQTDLLAVLYRTHVAQAVSATLAA
jgi:CBS domain-containing membrane protein